MLSSIIRQIHLHIFLILYSLCFEIYIFAEKMLANYHTHSTYCDGKEDIYTFIKKAIEQKMRQLGFSSHAPIPVLTNWTITDEFTLELYCKEVLKFKEEFKNTIELFLALETDYIPNISTSFDALKNTYHLDYIIGAVHLVKIPDSNDVWFVAGKQYYFDKGLEQYFNNDIKKAVTTYYHQLCDMITNERFDIIAHIDKIKLNNDNRFFNENESWYKACVNEMLVLMKENGIILEVNTRSYYQKKRTDVYPSDWILRQAFLMKIPVIVNSDAHHSDELTKGFDYAFAKLKQAGYTSHIIRQNGEWKEMGINHNDF